MPKPSRRVSHLTISTDRQLEQFCERVIASDRVALDTEFVSERSYRPILCLVQVAVGDDLALIDPLAVQDLKPFWHALAEPGHETIVHAGRGELEFSLRALGRRPAGLFDVQIAAGLAGIEYPAGFRTLINRVLGESPRKDETRTDWRRRPLSDRQIEYALDDVRHLSAICDRLHARLEELGRLTWMEEEMAAWEGEIERATLHERWRRVSGHSGLDRRSLAVVRELWRWREAEAERRDCPPRRVLRDDLIVELAKRQTADPKRIHAVRDMERGDLARLIPRIAESIHRALELGEDEWPHRHVGEHVPEAAVLGQFLFSALGSICRQASLAPGLVGSPGDVRELIAYRTGHWRRSKPPLLERGWRAQVVGHLFDELLAGRKSIRIADPGSDHPLVFEPVQTQAADKPDASAT